MTKAEILKITGQNKYVTDELVSALNDTIVKYQIGTKLRICHFLAQVLHESGAFRYVEELASGDAYDTRTDLGNTKEKDGDGRTWKGRGLIQITGKTNYTTLAKEFKVDLLIHPELLEAYPLAAMSAGWYWNSRNLNAWADKDDLITITKKINGGLNGLSDRQMWLDKCKANF